MHKIFMSILNITYVVKLHLMNHESDRYFIKFIINLSQDYTFYEQFFVVIGLVVVNDLLKNCGCKTTIGSSHYKTGYKQATRNSRSICPAGDQEVANEEITQSRQCKSTYRVWTKL